MYCHDIRPHDCHNLCTNNQQLSFLSIHFLSIPGRAVVAKFTVQIVGGPVIMLVDFVPNQDHRNKKCSDNSSVLVCDLVNYYK